MTMDDENCEKTVIEPMSTSDVIASYGMLIVLGWDRIYFVAVMFQRKLGQFHNASDLQFTDLGQPHYFPAAPPTRPQP